MPVRGVNVKVMTLLADLEELVNPLTHFQRFSAVYVSALLSLVRVLCPCIVLKDLGLSMMSFFLV